MTHTVLLRVSATAVLAASLGLVLTGCFGGGGGADAATPSSPTPIPTMAQPIPSGDGTLLIGLVVPLSGAESALGAPSLAGAELAARDIQQAGGVNGGPVHLVHADAGDASASAGSVTALEARGVDALVGPNAQALLPALAEAAAASGIAAVGATGEPVAVDEAFGARLRSSDPTLADTRYGVESYDAVVMIALAAALAGDDGRTSVQQFLPAVTTGAVSCSTYGACLDVLKTRADIRYTGVTGQLSTGVVQVTDR
jgi:ABC-type branched-subunit amino acid transport system substrate-binding protein